MAPHLANGCVLSDVGSTKGSVLRDLLPLLPSGIHLVPAHPMAGTEQSGPDAGFSTLFKDRWCILTPPPETDPAAVQKIELFWERAGSQVERMDAVTHDKVVAIVSHLPHLIAFTICSTADDLARKRLKASSDSPPRDFGISPGSLRPTWRCGVTCFSTIERQSWRCSPDLQKIAKHWREPYAAARRNSLRNV